MNWFTENSMLVLGGLVLFMLVWFVAFFVRNHQAKADQLHSLHGDHKEAGTTPVKRSDKL